MANIRKIQDAAYTATTAIASEMLGDGTHRSATLYVYATTAGTLQPQYIDEDSVARDLGGALAISANQLAVIYFEHPVTRIRTIFTPTTQPGNVQVDAALM